ncbi:ABC transporter permease subunit/CPBP intramembrane protease [Fuerstiella marisgermanici]|uniref:ABC-2 family transporter protein n=1 Tax=Fuerstiella marisgermanici TaxID=1891926 RepID=A0A1P8WK74_9PLAN|nr:ABC transporter permease subunit/CPBP intramembrane protease [Fuerstiella marisgermanici]APZ94438.1 ABC-2 family transporter protein [Fuerstiella marisgermanici]
MSWKNIKLIFLREVRDQLRDRRTLFMITILPVLLYPMLGLGVVQMMLTFSEQKRTVVVLNAKELPTDPAFLSEDGIRDEWFPGGADDAKRLRAVVDLPGSADETVPAGTHKARSDAELLKSGRQLHKKLTQYQAAAESEEDPAARAQIRDEISSELNDSGIQVLVMVPDGYAEAIAALQTDSSVSDDESVFVPKLQVLRNSADDKSAVAFGRIRNALNNWEDALRATTFEKAALRPELQHPASLEWIEVARGEEVAANVWSKLFPAMIVIMALTGAFYPAIDLGAGEKERGTMETLLISPARRVELVMGKFMTILLFSIGTALMNLLSMGFTGQHLASAMGAGAVEAVNLEFPSAAALMWLVILLVPLAALFSALCLALATFAKSTKEGQYYLTPLLMVILGLTMFCLNPAIEITPLYSVIPVVNVALLLKGLLLTATQSNDLLMYAIPVLVSSFGYSMLALWWAIDLYNSEGVLFREAEKFDVRLWFSNLTRDKEPVPALPEAVFCFIVILFLQFVAMKYMKPDLVGTDAVVGRRVMQTMVIQQLTMIACPAVFMGILLTTSLRATFRLRMPTLSSMLMGVGLAVLAHPLSVEVSSFVVEYGFLPAPPEEGLARISKLLSSTDLPRWLIITVFAVTPAICEELAFRGFILSGLARGGRLKVAIIVSSLMFGIIHMIPQQAFNAALLGLVLGLLAVHSRSLFPAMAFHFVNNTMATFHGRGGFGIKPDGVFFSETVFSEESRMLRYEMPTLILCGIGMAILIARMISDLRAEQVEKRELELRSFDAPASDANNLAAGI